MEFWSSDAIRNVRKGVNGVKVGTFWILVPSPPGVAGASNLIIPDDDSVTPERNRTHFHRNCENVPRCSTVPRHPPNTPNTPDRRRSLLFFFLCRARWVCWVRWVTWHSLARPHSGTP